MKGAALLAGLWCALATTSAFAQAPPAAESRAVASSPEVVLVYSVAAGCPAERELRSIVAAEIGHDPFRESSSPATPPPLTLRVSIVRQGGRFVSTLELRDPDGHVLASRPPFGQSTCRELIDVLGTVTIPILVDKPDPPPATPAPQPVATPSPSVAPPPVAPPPVAPAPVVAPPAAPAPRPSFFIPWPSVRLGLRAGVAIGVAPAPTGAFSFDAGVGWEHLSIAVEARTDVPVTGDGALGTRVRTSILAGSLVPCGHYRWLAGCVLISTGLFRSEVSNGAMSVQQSARYTEAGVRAGVEWPSRSTFAVQVSADVLTGLPKHFTNLGLIQVWQAGAVTFAGGVGVVGRFGGP